MSGFRYTSTTKEANALWRSILENRFSAEEYRKRLIDDLVENGEARESVEALTLQRLERLYDETVEEFNPVIIQ